MQTSITSFFKITEKKKSNENIDNNNNVDNIGLSDNFQQIDEKINQSEVIDETANISFKSVNVATNEEKSESEDSEDAPVTNKRPYKRLRCALSDDSEDDAIENKSQLKAKKKVKTSPNSIEKSSIVSDKKNIFRKTSPNSKENSPNILAKKNFLENLKNKRITESTPKKVKNNKNEKAEKSMNESKKTLLSSFSKTVNESTMELNESQIPENNPVDAANYDHFSFEFLKKEHIRDAQRRRPDHPDYDPSTLFVPESFHSKLTPAMKQWWKIKANGNMETLLLFKVGKFYELYHMDAVIAMNELGLSSMRGSYAHSGFPEIAFAKMADQLVLKGYKVARIEQTETVDAMTERIKHEGTKNKVVHRELCQIVTPGTRGFSLRNKTCREIGQEGSEEMGYIEDAGGLLYAFKESLVEDNLKGKIKYTASIGVAVVNTNTGKFTIAQFYDDDQRSRFRTMISRFPPNEILYLKGNLSRNTQQIFNTTLAATKKEGLINNKQFLSSETTLSRLLESAYFTETSQNKLSRFGLPIGLTAALNENDNLGRTAAINYDLAVSCIGALMYYLERCLIDKYLISVADFNIYTPVDGCESIQSQSSADECFYNHQSNMILDSNTLANLELLKNSNMGGIDGTLFERLDFCSTAFGRRLLIQWIATPLCNPQMIFERQEAITDLIDMDSRLSSIKSCLKHIPDLEKLVAKIHVLGLSKLISDHPDSRAVFYESLTYSRRKINDFVAAVAAFDNILVSQSKLTELISEHNVKSTLVRKIMLMSADDPIGEFPDIQKTIDFFKKAFDHEKAKKEGKIIPGRGVDTDYDEAITLIEDIEAELKIYLEKQKKIMNCNINYFGTGKNRFQLEIPESKCSNVPKSYVMSSSRKGFKRYLTTEIENLLNKLINAEEKRDVVLANIMSKIFARFDEHYLDWAKVINNIAQFDALLSLTTFSRGLDGGMMIRPDIKPIQPDEKPFVFITDGRYPCRAKTQTGEFISNTIKLGSLSNEKTKSNSVMLLTGPNMGGKSTLMRQTALIIILSQLGCYVPAEGPVTLTPVDRICTRQGANDSISTGQSTLQVELNEAAMILSYMTKDSFLLIDELGRGTATYDGCALAYSILKGISDNISPRTIFSTHFHKLLEEKEVTKNTQISHMACMVEEDNASVLDGDLKLQNITFLYKLTEGGCPKSYGFNAARLANIPEKIILNGLNKARLFEEETLILEFKKFLNNKNATKNDLKLWQDRFKGFYNIKNNS